jgi:hypothetical protein
MECIKEFTADYIVLFNCVSFFPKIVFIFRKKINKFILPKIGIKNSYFIKNIKMTVKNNPNQPKLDLKMMKVSNTKFNPSHYLVDDKTKHIVNFRSMGSRVGNYYFPNLNTFYNFIINNRLANRYCFIETKTPCYKLFFDFDIDDIPRTGENFSMLEYFFKNKIDLSKFWKYIINKVICALKYYIAENNGDKLFEYVYSRRTDVKYKLHLYFPNLIVNNRTALTIREKMIDLIKEDNIHNLTDGYINKIIDASVFKANGIRIPFQSKKYQNGHYVLSCSKSTSKIPDSKFDQLKLVSIKTNANFINFEPKLGDNDLSLLEHDGMIVVPKKSKSIKNRKNNNGRNNVYDDGSKELLECNYEYNFIYSLADNLSIDRLDDFEDWRLFVLLCGNYRWSHIAHKISKKSSKYNKIMINDLLNAKNTGDDLMTIASLIRWSNKDNPTKHKEIMDEHNKKIYIESKHDHSDNVKNFREYITSEINKQFGINVNILEISENHLTVLDTDNYDTFIIKSGLGTNKSGVSIKSIVEVVEKWDYSRIAAICSRIVLVSNLNGRMQEPIYGETDNRPENLKMKSYNEVKVKKDLRKEKRLVQTPDSLIHMMDDNSKIVFPEVVMIDEVESLYSYVIESDTLSDRRRMVFTIINEYIKRAKYVFLVDGNVTPFLCSYIINLRKTNKIQIIYNTKCTDDNKYYFINDEFEWMNRIYTDLIGKKKMFIGLDSKTMSEQIYEDLSTRFPDLRIKLYNVDTKDEDKINLKDANKVWKDYDVIIASPTILYGVDFSIQHFDAVYSYCQTTIYPSSVYQQIKRIRDLFQKEVFIHLTHPKNYSEYVWPTDNEQLRSDIRMYRKHYGHMVSCLKDVYEDGLKLDMNDDFTRLFLHFMKIRNQANNNYKAELVKYLTEYGGKVYTIHDKEKYLTRQLAYIETKHKFDTDYLCACKQFYVKKALDAIKLPNNNLFLLDNEYYESVIAKFDELYTNKLITTNVKHRDNRKKIKNKLDPILKKKAEYMNKIKKEKEEEIKNYKEAREKINNDKDGNIEKLELEHIVNIILLNDKLDDKIAKDNYRNEQSKIKEVLNEKWIGRLLVGNTRTNEYQTIIHKTFKTTEDKDIMVAHHIKSVFGLNTLSTDFLKHIKHLSQVDNFYKSLIYLACDDYKKRFIERYKGTEKIDRTMITFRQAEIISEILKLFWQEGLLDNSTIQVFSKKNNLTDEQLLFISKNEKDMRSLFGNLKRKAKPVNSFQLLSWVDSMLKEFFGGFVKLNISNRKHKRINKQCFFYYDISVNNLCYIELILNKNKNIIHKDNTKYIKKNFKNEICQFNELHNHNTFNNAINYVHDMEYMFT